MATKRDLVKAVAAVRGIEEVRQAGIHRYCAEAGLLTKKGRGRGAPIMTSRDAAILVLGAMNIEPVQDVVAVIKALMSTRLVESVSNFSHFKESAFTGLHVLDEKHSFVDAVEALIESTRIGAPHAALAERGKEDPVIMEPFVAISVHFPIIMGDIDIRGGERTFARYADGRDAEKESEEDYIPRLKAVPAPSHDAAYISKASFKTIKAVAVALNDGRGFAKDIGVDGWPIDPRHPALREAL